MVRVTRWLLVVSVLLVLIAASAALDARQMAAAAATPVTLALPGRANATPWIAAQGRHVAVVWAATLAGKSDIVVAMSIDAGATFAAPVQVNTVSGDGRVSGEIPPRVALRARAGTTPEVVVAWNAKDQGTEIKVARSVDGGATFSVPVSLQAPGAAGDRGWHALALDDQGVAHVLWLDHRGLAGPKTDHVHGAAGDETDGVAMAQKSSLYYASFGAVAAAERAITPGVCYCCKSAIVALPGGTLVSAWRHVYAGNMRDMAFTVSRDGGRTFAAPTRVSGDGWSINGCPDDGPALAAADRRVHIVWPTVIPGAEPMGALFYSALRDDGTFAPRTRIPTLGSPKPSHPQVVVDDAGRLVVAWDESLAGVRTAAYSVGVRQADGAVQFGPPTRLAGPGGPTLYPVMATTGSGVVAAWTSGVPGASVIHVRQLVAAGAPASAPR